MRCWPWLCSCHQRLGITCRQKNRPAPGSWWLLQGIQAWRPFRATQFLGREARPGCPLEATEALVRVYYAALPATLHAELGLGGAAIAAVSVSGRGTGPLVSAVGATIGGIPGGGPHIARFICSATLCRTCKDWSVGGAARTLDHRQCSNGLHVKGILAWTTFTCNSRECKVDVLMSATDSWKIHSIIPLGCL